MKQTHKIIACILLTIEFAMHAPMEVAHHDAVVAHPVGETSGPNIDPALMAREGIKANQGKPPVLTDAQKVDQTKLSTPARLLSKAGESLGFKSQGFFLGREEAPVEGKAINKTAALEEVSFNEADAIPLESQAIPMSSGLPIAESDAVNNAPLTDATVATPNKQIDLLQKMVIKPLEQAAAAPNNVPKLTPSIRELNVAPRRKPLLKAATEFNAFGENGEQLHLEPKVSVSNPGGKGFDAFSAEPVDGAANSTAHANVLDNSFDSFNASHAFDKPTTFDNSSVFDPTNTTKPLTAKAAGKASPRTPVNKPAEHVVQAEVVSVNGEPATEQIPQATVISVHDAAPVNSEAVQTGARLSTRTTIKDKINNAFSSSKKTTSTDATTKAVTEKTTNKDGSISTKVTSEDGKTSVETITSADGKVLMTRNVHDDGSKSTVVDGKVISEVTADGHTIKHEFDANGNPTKSIETIPSASRFSKSTIKTTTYAADGKTPPEISVTDSSGKSVKTNTTSTVSDKVNNALAVISGNKKITTTDPATGKTTVTTTAKDGSLLATKTTNSKGQVIETSSVNPVSGAKTTVTYKDPTGKDKSSTTKIEKSNDPLSPITEERDADGKLKEVKDKDGNDISTKDKDGNIIATKTTITTLEKLTDPNQTPDKVFAEDVSTAQYQAAQKLMAKLIGSDKVTTNTKNLAVEALKAPEEDVNSAYRTTRDFEKASRTTVHSKFNELTSTISAAKRLGQPVDQVSFTKDLIQKQIDNHLGSDMKTGQSKFVLSADQHSVITDLLVKDPKYKPLFDSNSKISNVEKLNLIADMGDVALNMMSDGIAEFHTSFAADGTCTSTTTSKNLDGSSITLSSSFDNDGNPTTNSIAIDGTTYTTVVGKDWLYGKSPTTVTVTDMSTGFKEGTPLESKDGAFLSQGWILNKSITATKLAIKVVLSAPKQIVANGVGMVIPTVAQGVALAVYIPVVKITSMIPAMHVKNLQGEPAKVYEADPVTGQNKQVFEKDRYGNTKIDPKTKEPIPKLQVKSFTGYQFTGHDFSDPALRLTTLKLADISGLGDDGSGLTSQALAKTASAVGIKGMDGPLMATGKGSPVFNPDTPMAKGLAALQGKTPEQAAQDAADLNASYATIMDPVVAAVQAPFKYFFKQSVGDRILSKSDLTSTSTSTSDTSTTSAQADKTLTATATGNKPTPPSSSLINTVVKNNNRSNAVSALSGGGTSGSISLLSFLLI